MNSPLVAFIVAATVAALLMWAFSQFPTLDPAFVKFIRIALMIVLSLMLINLILVLIFGQGLSWYLGTHHA